jgi:hypothetical protein
MLALLALGCADVKPAPQTVAHAAPTPVATPVASGHPTAVMCSADYRKEVDALRCAEGAAYRHGDTLFVRLTDGRVLRHLNEAGPETSDYYRYTGVLRGGGGARTFHLIERTNGQYAKVLVLDAASGDTMTLAETPLMSPDSTRFLLSDAYVNICGDSSSFSVWRITAGRPEREWVSHASCGTARSWSVARPEWRSADTIALRRVAPSDTGRKNLTQSPAHLIRRAAGWSFETEPRQDRTLSIQVLPSSLEVHRDTVRIAYTVTNALTSTSELFDFTVDAPAPALKVEKPRQAPEWDINTAREYGRSVARWGFIEPMLLPGKTSPPLAFSALGLPGIVKYWGDPWIPPDTVDDGDVPVQTPTTPAGPGAFADDSGVTVGVVPFPKDRSRAALLRRLSGLVTDACARGWVDDRGVCNSLRVKIQHDETRALLSELEAQRGKHVNDVAYFLIAGNVWALRSS